MPGASAPGLFGGSMEIVMKDGRRKTVKDSVGRALVKIGKATESVDSAPVYQTRAVNAETPEVSERTGKPKRKYRRRDMQDED